MRFLEGFDGVEPDIEDCVVLGVGHRLLFSQREIIDGLKPDAWASRSRVQPSRLRASRTWMAVGVIETS